MASTGTSASNVSLADTLALLDGPFESVAKGVSTNQYALWLGSGISRQRMPPTKDLVIHVLAHLQTKCDPGDSECRFAKALDAIIALAKPSADEQSQINYKVAPASWACTDIIAERLTSNYARMLDSPPDGEELDYLVWTALDVAAVYGNPNVKPDVEHLAIAALAVEGVTTDIASANWDGLVEKAAVEITGGSDVIRVVVQQSDLRKPASQSTLYKFHGCAVLAGSDPQNYREHIVGRASQINGFAALSKNQAVTNRLTDLAATKPTLMVGMSAQDANIQGVFAQASANMNWPWPSTPPACVFAEDVLGTDQVGLLHNVYSSSFTTSTSAAIKASAHLRAFGRTLLPALWMDVLRRKLKELIHLNATLPIPERVKLEAGLSEIRDRVAAGWSPGQQETYFREIVKGARRALSLFRKAEEPSPTGALYEALTSSDVSSIATDPSLPNTGLPELAIALGLFGLRANQGGWDIRVSDPTSSISGAMCVVTPLTSVEVFFAANADIANKMFRDGVITESAPVVLVHSHAIPERFTRSPRLAVGRDGGARVRELSISEIITEAPMVDDALERLREEVSL